MNPMKPGGMTFNVIATIVAVLTIFAVIYGVGTSLWPDADSDRRGGVRAVRTLSWSN
jgi:hypothetical protein